MHVDFLIIGQGISGTFLSYYLEKEGKSFIVIDDHQPNSPSRIAAGIINPVTGRRFVKTWMIDDLIPFVKEAYTAIGKKIDHSLISQKDIIEFFPSPFMRDMFLSRYTEEPTYLELPDDENNFRHLFNYEFGYGCIHHSLIVQIDKLLPAWRRYLHAKKELKEEVFDISALKVTNDKVTYGDISSDRIIFCDGIASAAYPFFQNLPFAFNKGEALIVEINEFPVVHIYKKGIHLAPTAQKDIFWAGSNYLWKFDNDQPTPEFRKEATAQLKQWLKMPFTIVEHLASIRPATIERRPFVGIHPLYKNVAILNGMGTKGCSLVPYFAKQLAKHLISDHQIDPDADIKRFTKVLGREL